MSGWQQLESKAARCFGVFAVPTNCGVRYFGENGLACREESCREYENPSALTTRPSAILCAALPRLRRRT